MTPAPVNLPLPMARCPSTRTVGCEKAASCARALVAGAGRPVQDYSIEARDSFGACTHYLPAEKFRGQEASAARPAREFVKGLL